MMQNVLYQQRSIDRGNTGASIYRRLVTKVLDKVDSTRQEKTDYSRVLPYMII